jgi:flagellar biosynthesis protein FlhG
VVVSNEPASITDAYALIKVLSRDHGLRRFHVLPNMVADAREGQILFQRLSAVAERYLEVQLDLAGIIPLDPAMRSAVRAQQCIFDRYPGSAAAQAFRTLAHTVRAWPRRTEGRGEMRFFLERLFADMAPALRA